VAGSAGTSFPLKLALAGISLFAYAALTAVMPALEGIEGAPRLGGWFHLTVGAVFGALVLAPYARAPQRALRGMALAAASAGIYYLAVWFVTGGPAGLDAVVSFVLAGAGAAMLCGVAVVVLAPRRFDWRLWPLLLVAGAVGGAAFDLNFAFDPVLLIAHAAWQLLVCLALHLGLRGDAA
jgi:hypothetical protein